LSKESPDSIWSIITELADSDIAILHLKNSDDQTNPYLNDSLEYLISKSNQIAGQETDIPFIKPDVGYYSFIYKPQIKNLTSSDPNELALSELLRHKGASSKTKPVHGYHLFLGGTHATYSQEKSLMEGDAAEAIKFFSKRVIGKKEDKRKLTAKPLAAHFFNYVLEYFVREKDDAVEKMRRNIASRDKIALGTAMAFFGLDGDAGKEDLAKARKQLLAKSHPDLAANDEVMRKEKEMLAMKINQTYDFINARIK
jgi:hypothetical protein